MFAYDGAAVGLIHEIIVESHSHCASVVFAVLLYNYVAVFTWFNCWKSRVYGKAARLCAEFIYFAKSAHLPVSGRKGELRVVKEV